ncbi:thioredoxin 2 [Escherichia coli]|uniref:Thioredoxin 2 n=1 Tax=Escherichia coli TaxID=562 RepID=A0A485JEA1_ECOLX|nr:thioredoxin 2 [Escherichia coli]
MNTVCTHCQAINRIPDDRIEDAAKCGRCGHDLFDGEVINATGETLDKLLKDDLPVVIDFWARGAAPAVISHQFLKMSRKSVAVKCAL